MEKLLLDRSRFEIGVEVGVDIFRLESESESLEILRLRSPDQKGPKTVFRMQLFLRPAVPKMRESVRRESAKMYPMTCVICLINGPVTTHQISAQCIQPFPKCSLKREAHVQMYSTQAFCRMLRHSTPEYVTNLIPID